MGSGIFSRKAGELIFHNNSKASLISQDSTSIRGAIRVLRKLLLLVLEKSHILVLSCAMATSNPTHKQTEKGKRKREEEDDKRKREEIGKGRANKTARVKWGRGKREANGK